ncbi:hypothetical protein SAMN03159474_00957 [Pseudomonas sp. NFACC08-1]|nr:hypothetical protein SAMN03159474_00957 [Pseudomonas sp. NFACC08-1]
MKKDIALELCDIRREFRINKGFFKPAATLKAVDGVSLRLMRGETLGLVGESGAEKVPWQSYCSVCWRQPAAMC